MKTHTSQSRGTTRLASELNVVFIKELFNYFANVWNLEILSKNKLYTFFCQKYITNLSNSSMRQYLKHKSKNSGQPFFRRLHS